MVTMDGLVEAFYHTIKTKTRSEDYIIFAMHLELNLQRLLVAINNRTLQPTAYTFVATNPKPREVFATDFATRIAHHYLDIRLRPLIEKRLTDVTFNNRIGYGTDAAFNKLIEYIYDATEGHTKDAWVISADLSGYFPNASQDLAYEQLRKLVEEDYVGEDKEDVLWLVMRCIYSYPTEHCYRKSPIYYWSEIPDAKSLFKKENGIGAAIGYLVWQNEMNYYLNDFDHYMIDECHYRYLRFVDDMRWVVTPKEKDALLAKFPLFREMLAAHGCKFNESKFSCQKACRGGNFIGHTYKGKRVYPTNRIKRHWYSAIIKYNQRISPKNIDKFLSALNSYTGILKNCNGRAIIHRGLRMLDARWYEYVRFDEQRLCFVAQDGWTYRHHLNKNYKLVNKFKKDDNRFYRAQRKRHFLRYHNRHRRRRNKTGE